MSTVSLPNLQRTSREALSKVILTEPSEEKITVIDVRDADHVGGHIKSSQHVPSESLPYAAPELVHKLAKTEKVVFHCALSQQRGPSAALKYLRERERLFGIGSIETENKGLGVEEAKERDEEGKVKRQEVYVLDGGFVKWQEKYGEDEKLTEKYDKELWKDGY